MQCFPGFIFFMFFVFYYVFMLIIVLLFFMFYIFEYIFEYIFLNYSILFGRGVGMSQVSALGWNESQCLPPLEVSDQLYDVLLSHPWNDFLPLLRLLTFLAWNSSWMDSWSWFRKVWTSWMASCRRLVWSSGSSPLGPGELPLFPRQTRWKEATCIVDRRRIRSPGGSVMLDSHFVAFEC